MRDGPTMKSTALDNNNQQISWPQHNNLALNGITVHELSNFDTARFKIKTAM